MPARILVIEDNAENLALITYLLSAFGHIVLVAHDGVEGLEAAARELPDLVISDLQMPRLDGYEVARAFRKDPRLALRPLIAVTSYAMRGDRERVLAAGFDGYISKPIQPDEFVGQVEQYLAAGHRSAAPAVIPANPSQQQRPAAFHTTILAVDNSPVNLQLVANTLEPFGYKVIAAHSAREAMALARENRPQLILSDLHMPDADGLELFRSLQSDPELRGTPFAIISATYYHDADTVEARRLGISTFIRRPLDPQQLVAEVEACLALHRQAPIE